MSFLKQDMMKKQINIKGLKLIKYLTEITCQPIIKIKKVLRIKIQILSMNRIVKMPTWK